MLVLFASLILVVQAGGQSTPPATPAPPAAAQRPAPPPIYSSQADARAQIDAALKFAKEDGIRVLVNFGAYDDDASKAFAGARRDRELSKFFSDEYRTVNVDVGRLDRNLDVAQSFGVTLKPGELPVLIVLDADGKVLTRTSGAAFRSDSDATVYDPVKIAAFLKASQAPPAPDAQPLFDAALQKAKSEGKTLFVWFSAPW
jgi:protein disulfide-isomerase